MFLNAVMVRDSVRKLPELRDIASRKYPRLPLSDLCVKINYTVVPPTFGVFPLHDSQTIFPSDEAIANTLIKLSGDAADIQRVKRTLIVGEISDGNHSSNMFYVMDSLLWDNSEYGRLDTMIRAAQSSANHLGSQRGARELPGSWQCVGRRSELDHPKLRRRIEKLVEEERRRWKDVQDTWLTA